MAEEKKGGMTVAEAGRKGGVKVAQERGRAFYEQIGRKGGETVKAERGHEFYEQIGKKGGESVRAARGPEFYSQIGHKGGQRVRELIEKGKRLARESRQSHNERVVYGLLSCPNSVAIGVEFAVTIGVAPTPEPGVAATKMLLQDAPEIRIDVTLILPVGCSLRAGELASNRLLVRRHNPF